MCTYTVEYYLTIKREQNVDICYNMGDFENILLSKCKMPLIVWFYSHEMSRIGNGVDDSDLVVVSAGQMEGNGERPLMAMGIFSEWWKYSKITVC